MTEEKRAESIAFKECFSTESGKKVLSILDRVCLFHGDIFVAESERITCFNLGKNADIRYIHREIERNLDEKPQETVRHETTPI